MKVLVFEYITGGGLSEVSVPPGLAREGRLMRRALLEDLLLADDALELVCLHDDRHPPDLADRRLRWVAVDRAQAYQDTWRERMMRCDAVWPIAPESDGVLETLCAEVEASGRTLLNCPARAVRLAASKRATAERLRAHGVTSVETLTRAEYRERTRAGGVPWEGCTVVIKPDDGVGCEGARIVSAREACSGEEASATVVQPLLEGDAFSLSALFADGRAGLLAVNRQRIARRADRFAFSGCRVNALADVDGRWQALSDAIAAAVPELWGYAGVDGILTAQGPCILEINPRLTTSYVGLRQATGVNPAACVLELARTGALPRRRAFGGVAVDIQLEPAHDG
jgi:predicted ATP-grasp superfamily ATP-dependent carboligase